MSEGKLNRLVYRGIEDHEKAEKDRKKKERKEKRLNEKALASHGVLRQKNDRLFTTAQSLSDIGGRERTSREEEVNIDTAQSPYIIIKSITQKRGYYLAAKIITTYTAPRSSLRTDSIEPKKETALSEVKFFTIDRVQADAISRGESGDVGVVLAVDDYLKITNYEIDLEEKPDGGYHIIDDAIGKGAEALQPKGRFSFLNMIDRREDARKVAKKLRRFEEELIRIHKAINTHPLNSHLKDKIHATKNTNETPRNTLAPDALGEDGLVSHIET